MKPARVTMTIAAVAVLLLAVFLLPLPVSRVRETGLIQVHPQYVAQRHVHVERENLRLHDAQRRKRRPILPPPAEQGGGAGGADRVLGDTTIDHNTRIGNTIA